MPRNNTLSAVESCAYLAFGSCLFRAVGKPLGFLERGSETPQRVLQPTDLPSRIAALGRTRGSIQLVRARKDRLRTNAELVSEVRR